MFRIPITLLNYQTVVTSPPSSCMSGVVLQELLTEFLEVWLHNIVYICNIYPSQIFRSRYKYCVNVKQSTYPPLNNYLRKLVLSMQTQLAQQAIHSITVNIYNGLQTEESFLLLLSYPPQHLPTSPLSPEECVAQCKDAFRSHVTSVLHSQSQSPREVVEQGRGFSVSMRTSELAGSQLTEWCSETVQEEMGAVTPFLFSDVGPLRMQSLHRQGAVST